MPAYAHSLFLLGFVLALVNATLAFAPGAALPSCATSTCQVTMRYIPDGLTQAQWDAIKEKEQAKASKNLGRVGATSFKSRSFQAWQQAMENGEGGHLFPVDPRKVKTGEIKLSEVPYMQRRGSWDDEDLLKKEKGIQKKAWTPTDKAYADGGERAQQSVNIFGTGANLPWNGRAAFKDPTAVDPIKEQAKWRRATSPLPPNKMALERVAKEKAKLAAQQAKKEKELAPTLVEGKRFLFF
ncbi:hypothetical protein JKP88DRAFT_296035 [Tribonema minus]|uniref:Uncharacterized protein n=1 Tax=Tribonema minus TaxID=303371 RepID=A0A835ZE56_9STRA|nr:hypothetical protein JKP88DRAFT_296035 [Tribonema minus]